TRHALHAPYYSRPAIIWLALAGPNWAISHFMIILRDHAESDLIHNNRALLGLAFQSLMDNILIFSIIVALTSTLLSIFGMVLAIISRWLHQNDQRRIYFECLQAFVALIAVCAGAYIASCVHRSRLSHGHLPYYGIICYGAVGQAAFGSVMIIFSVAQLFMCN
ncbi:hypothetical protein N7451_012745, partial [Penicillium sp. IBT 35674x]